MRYQKMNVITETLAAGLHKRSEVLLRECNRKLKKELSNKSVRTAQAWMRNQRRFFIESPAQIVLYEYSWDKNTRHEKNVSFRLVDTNNYGAWTALLVELIAKKREMNEYPLGLDVSKHSLQRLLQYQREKNINKALESIKPALLYALAISIKLLPYEKYLAIPNGALVLEPSSKEEDVFVVVTVLKDDDRVRGGLIKDVKVELLNGFNFMQAILDMGDAKNKNKSE
jgi:hypothetical protein